MCRICRLHCEYFLNDRYLFILFFFFYPGAKMADILNEMCWIPIDCKIVIQRYRWPLVRMTKVGWPHASKPNLLPTGFLQIILITMQNTKLALSGVYNSKWAKSPKNWFFTKKKILKKNKGFNKSNIAMSF